MKRTYVKIELPDHPDIREWWTDDGFVRVNTCAQEGAMLRYDVGGYNACSFSSNAEMKALEMDVIREQTCFTFDEEMMRMIRGLFIGWEQSVCLFQYGVMVGKRIERDRRKMEAVNT